MYSDVAQGIIHFCNHKRWYGHLTLALVFTPAIINSVYTAVMFYSSDGKIVLGVKFPHKKLIYLLCLCLHGNIARQIIWLYALKTETVKDQNLAKELALTKRDMSFYLQVFFESLPQMWLQLYIMIVRYGDFSIMGVISLSTAFMTASWGVLLMFENYKSKFFAFQLNALWMCSRVLALAVFASVIRAAPFILLAVHFIAVLPLWFYEIKRQPFVRRGQRQGLCHAFISDLFFAVLYAVCNTVTPMVTMCYVPLSIVFFIENTGCCIAVYYFGVIRRLKDNIRENLNFRNWQYASAFMIAFSVVTILAFVQTTILFFLKHRKVLKKDFMQSSIMKIIHKIHPIKAFKKYQKTIKNKGRAEGEAENV